MYTDRIKLLKNWLNGTNLVNGIKLQSGKDREIHGGDYDTGKENRDDRDPILRTKVVNLCWSTQDRHAWYEATVMIGID